MIRISRSPVRRAFRVFPRRIGFAVLAWLAAHSAANAIETFTIATLPDTQHYSDSASRIVHFNNQTQWIADNHLSENIVLATHLGDIVEHGGNTIEWARADAAIDLLDAGAPDLAYGMALGNHGQDDGWNLSNLNGPASNYIANFGSARFAGKSWYGGAAPDQRSHYQLFQGGGREFLNISLEWHGLDAVNTNQAEVASWAQSVLDAHPNTPAIISTHEYLHTWARTGYGQTVFDTLIKDNSQVFMAIGGHIIGRFHQTSQNTAGDDVFEVLANYQGGFPNGGNGWMQLLEFDEDNGAINVTTYSPSLDDNLTGIEHEFSFGVDFDDRFGIVPEPSGATTCVVALLCLLVWSTGAARRHRVLA
jgi:hypothetical protein